MEIQKKCTSVLFQRKIIASAVAAVVFSGLMTNTFANEGKKWSHTESYLDPAIWSEVVDEKACFNAAPNSILQVQPITSNGKRMYKVAHYFDINLEKKLYEKPIEAQIQEQKIIGKKFCQGIVSVSDMQLPFAKGKGINDANDGLLLVEAVVRKVSDIQEHLYQLTKIAYDASSGIYSSIELSNLNTEFSALLAEVNTSALTSRFNGINLLDGSTTMLNVPVNGGVNNVTINLPTLTTGSEGLSIASLDVSTNTDAQTALSTLNSMTAITASMSSFHGAEFALNGAAIRDGVTTLVDVRTDEFVVQHQGPSSKAKV